MRALALRVSALFPLLVVAAMPSTAQSITITPEIAVLDREATLHFGAPVDTLFVTYRPNSVLAQRDTIRIGGFDSVKWTPKRAGVVQIALPGGASQNVSVRFTAPPMSGIAILIVAGLILFGGAILSMRALFSDGAPLIMPEDMPDT